MVEFCNDLEYDVLLIRIRKKKRENMFVLICFKNVYNMEYRNPTNHLPSQPHAQKNGKVHATPVLNYKSSNRIKQVDPRETFADATISTAFPGGSNCRLHMRIICYVLTPGQMDPRWWSVKMIYNLQNGNPKRIITRQQLQM